MNAKVICAHMNGTGFNNVPHMHNFFNYLFRTDVNQKWTNKLTQFNLYMFFNDKGELTLNTFGSSLEERKEAKNNFYKVLMPYIRKYPNVEILNDILYFEILESEFRDGSISVDKLIEIFKYLIKSSSKIIRETLFVMHIDQEESEFHIHSVFPKMTSTGDKW